jgi:hypothetical protein
MYRYTTIEPCLQTDKENSIKGKVINYFQKPDSTKSSIENDPLYYIERPDADNIKVKFKFMEF